jgi:hypothetical protein
MVMSQAPKAKIDWKRMGWQWWLDAGLRAAFVGTFGFLVLNTIPLGEPKWVANLFAFGLLMVGVIFFPFPPRVGEEGPMLRFHHALMAFGILLAFPLVVLVGAAFIYGFDVIFDALVRPLLARVSPTNFLLALIALLLLGIYERLGKRSS